MRARIAAAVGGTTKYFGAAKRTLALLESIIDLMPLMVCAMHVSQLEESEVIFKTSGKPETRHHSTYTR